MKRIVLLVLGGVSMLLAIGLAVGGTALVVVFRDDGWIESARKRVAVPTYALVSRPAEIERSLPFGDDSLDVTIRVAVGDADGDGEVFVGIAETADVDRYLAQVAVDEIADVEWSRSDVTTDRILGRARPDLPTSQDFWVASVSGPGRQVFEWEIVDGSYRVVVMNADASRGLDLNGRFAVQLPFARPLGIVLIVVGAVLGALGVVLVVFGVRARPASAAPGSGPGALWPPSPPGGSAVPPDAPSAPWTAPGRGQSP